MAVWGGERRSCVAPIKGRINIVGSTYNEPQMAQDREKYREAIGVGWRVHIVISDKVNGGAQTE